MSLRVLICAFAAYSALTVVMTWPLVLHLGSALPHDAEDPLLSASILWWNSHVLPLTKRWLDGFFFYPAGGALALSDHRLGLSLIASPLLWLGLGPVAAHNIAFLATYPLCATAAHGLAFTLTRRHDAAALCALAFGFNPFRVEHLPHLELAAAFGMPAALWALHLFTQTRAPKWLAAFGAALTMQGLCASYYFVFFLIFVALWIFWFMRWSDWRTAAAIVAVCLACAVVLSPIAIEYWRVHRQLGLSREFREVVLYSADVTSIFTAARLIAAWGWTAPLNGNEARIFPGATIMILSALGAIAAFRRRPAAVCRSRMSILLLAVAAVFSGVAAFTAAHGPWRVAIGPLAASGGVAFKPLSVALAAIVGSVAFSAAARDAYRDRSPFAFYLLAAVVMFVCALGPRPRFLGHQILYEPPYAWLMRLPVFDTGVRVPARFAMLMALALSAAAAIAFSRLVPRRAGRVAFAVAAAGILADTWVPGIPLAPAPDCWNPVRAEKFAAVLELPLGGTGEDVTAMYRAIRHHRPTINGYSGYSAPHYNALRFALADRDHTAIDSMAIAGPLLIVAEKDGEWARFLREHRGASALDPEGRWVFFSVPRRAEAPPVCTSGVVALAAASDNRGPVPIAAFTDGNRLTFWTLGRPQQVGDMLTLDLGRVATPCAVTLSQLGFEASYPRTLTVATSLDGSAWQTAFAGKTGGLLVRAVLASPLERSLDIPLPASPARFIRLRLDEATERDAWVVADLKVRGAP